MGEPEEGPKVGWVNRLGRRKAKVRQDENLRAHIKERKPIKNSTRALSTHTHRGRCGEGYINPFNQNWEKKRNEKLSRTA